MNNRKEFIATIRQLVILEGAKRPEGRRSAVAESLFLIALQKSRRTPKP